MSLNHNQVNASKAGTFLDMRLQGCSLPVIHKAVVVLGSGPGGFSAALYAARYGNATALISGSVPGGQLTITADVENYPGIRLPIQGPKLMEDFAYQATACGVEIIADHIEKVDFSAPALLCYGSKGVYISDAVIIATGASAKWLETPGEAQYKNRGISACATCDGPLFRNKDVAVIGGGNTAAEEALFLANYANSVVIIHRRDVLRADQVLQQRLKEHPKISFLWNHKVLGFLGQETPQPHLTAIEIEDVNTGAHRSLSVQGVFVAIGHTPNTEIFRPWLACDSHGYLLPYKAHPHAPNVYTPSPWGLPIPGPSTEISGVFMAGDVCDSHYRQAISAAGMGCQAAIEAQRYLQTLGR